MKLYTIGVFHSTEEAFFQKLVANKIDTFCDIRRRRAVRGSKYVFVNSIRLQQQLAAITIRYLHILDLAPTEVIRSIQKLADKTNGVTNTVRQLLDKNFIAAYNRDILDRFDFGAFIIALKEAGSKNVVFFCVEEEASACHRSLVVERMSALTGVTVTHL